MASEEIEDYELWARKAQVGEIRTEMRVLSRAYGLAGMFSDEAALADIRRDHSLLKAELRRRNLT